MKANEIVLTTKLKQQARLGMPSVSSIFIWFYEALKMANPLAEFLILDFALNSN